MSCIRWPNEGNPPVSTGPAFIIIYTNEVPHGEQQSSLSKFLSVPPQCIRWAVQGEVGGFKGSSPALSCSPHCTAQVGLRHRNSGSCWHSQGVPYDPLGGKWKQRDGGHLSPHKMLASCNVGCNQGISSGDLRQSSQPVFVALLHLYNMIGPKMVSAAKGEVRLRRDCQVQVT